MHYKGSDCIVEKMSHIYHGIKTSVNVPMYQHKVMEALRIVMCTGTKLFHQVELEQLERLCSEISPPPPHDYPY